LEGRNRVLPVEALMMCRSWRVVVVVVAAVTFWNTLVAVVVVVVVVVAAAVVNGGVVAAVFVIRTANMSFTINTHGASSRLVLSDVVL
jgi:hypothetical protein